MGSPRPCTLDLPPNSSIRGQASGLNPRAQRKEGVVIDPWDPIPARRGMEGAVSVCPDAIPACSARPPEPNPGTQHVGQGAAGPSGPNFSTQEAGRNDARLPGPNPSAPGKKGAVLGYRVWSRLQMSLKTLIWPKDPKVEHCCSRVLWKPRKQQVSLGD